LKQVLEAGVGPGMAPSSISPSNQRLPLDGKGHARFADTNPVISKLEVRTRKSELGHMTTNTILWPYRTGGCIGLQPGGAGYFISSLCYSSLP